MVIGHYKVGHLRKLLITSDTLRLNEPLVGSFYNQVIDNTCNNHTPSVCLTVIILYCCDRGKKEITVKSVTYFSFVNIIFVVVVAVLVSIALIFIHRN